MMNPKLLTPESIVVVGASNDVRKPGGKVLKNLLASSFAGTVYAVNPKESEVQGVKCYSKVDDLPQVDCAILAIAAKYCPYAVDVLAKQKGTGGFIILSAGFSEENAEGAALERQIVDSVNAVNGSLIGPNCTGFLNANYCGAFDTPVPPLDAHGVDFITGSGATAVFIKEYGITNGLTFNSVWAVGNSAQTGIEDVLEHLDATFNPETSSRVIMLYMENVKNPRKLLESAVSLIGKGCRIAAIKAGASAAGSRAASSHTGAIATPDVAVDALFRKAGIVRCHNREELTTVCSVFMHPEVKGKNVAIITHAGGPAVMLTDVLTNNGLNVPRLDGPAAEKLLSKLFPGSSVGNPIDFLATGTAEQLGFIIDACENEFDNIDAMVVIFGSPGLFSNWEVYELLDRKMKSCKKPIFPVLPSIINVKDEISDFIRKKKRINFPEECVFGNALAKVVNAAGPQPLNPELPSVETAVIRQIINQSESGYLPADKVWALLDAAGISRNRNAVVTSESEALAVAHGVGFPLALKVVGPLHKSEVNGVALNVENDVAVCENFRRLMSVPNAVAVEISPMLSGTEVFIGASKEGKFGHQILFGLGGIFVEVMKDVQTSLAPVAKEEASSLIKKLKGYRLIQGYRGRPAVNEELFADTVARVSALVAAAPEIAEMDLNPLLGSPDSLTTVDARIRIEKL